MGFCIERLCVCERGGRGVLVKDGVVVWAWFSERMWHCSLRVEGGGGIG